MTAYTFQAPNLAEAYDVVHRELGPEAFVLSVREVPSGSPWQVWRPRMVEVLASLEPTSTKDLQAFKSTTALAETHPASSPVDFYQRSTISIQEADKSNIGNTTDDSSPNLSATLKMALETLVKQQLDKTLLQKIVTTCHETSSLISQEKAGFVRDHLGQQLIAGLKVRDRRALKKDRLVCLVGRRGSGKTATGAKLAWHNKNELRRNVAWICADTFHLASISEARILAETLDIPLRLVYTPDDLKNAVDECSEADLVLVDMPGINPHRESEIIEIGAFLTKLPTRATYIMAPATVKDEDVMDIVTAFRPFDPSGLVLTHLDETSRYGGAYNVSWKNELPLHYFTYSAQVMEGLDPASSKRLVAALFGRTFD